MRIRGAVLLAAAAAVAASVLTAPAAGAAPSTDRFALGDSVMLGARTALKDRGFAVDATESRQSYAAPALLRQRSGSLPENVVVHMGTNGTFPLSTCRAIVRAAGPERRVFLVTVFVPRSWERANNATIRRCAEGFADGRVHVIDWHAAAAKHRSWLYSDRIHLKPAGAAAFARLLDSAVDRAEQEARAQALAQASGRGVAGVDG